MTLTQVLIAVAGALLLVAALLALWRLAKGPTSLDRGVASDLIIAVLIASVGAHAMWTRTSLGLLLILVLSLLGFTGAVGLARLITGAARNQSLYVEGNEAAHDTSADGGPR